MLINKLLSYLHINENYSSILHNSSMRAKRNLMIAHEHVRRLILRGEHGVFDMSWRAHLLNSFLAALCSSINGIFTFNGCHHQRENNGCVAFWHVTFIFFPYALFHELMLEIHLLQDRY